MDAQTQAEPPKCLICLDDDIELIDIPEAKICVPCLERAFRLATNDPTSYPVRLCNAVLKIEPFQHLLPADVVTAFRISQHMYETPRLYRLFCAARSNDEVCGKFLGDTRSFGSGSFNVQCSDCHAYTCVCGEAVRQDGPAHRCNIESERELPGCEKGKTWQRCPKRDCKAVVTRTEGCNAMTCGHRRTEFCWLCGKKVLNGDNDRHWWAEDPIGGERESPYASYAPIPDYVAERYRIPIHLTRLCRLHQANQMDLADRLGPILTAKIGDFLKKNAVANSDQKLLLQRIQTEIKEL